ncbi:MAG: hypothetical protein LBO69_03625 [Ignavibacteria bacterium]|nr:hypothetical protein [Ignavibacteria bacterium]
MKYKSIVLLFLITSALLFSGCATKIPFEQTCLNCVQSQRLNCKGSECPSTILSNGQVIAVFAETGEKINLTYILSEEKLSLEKGIPLAMAKVRGRYFVVGQGFSNLWVLTPSENEAKVKSFPLPNSNLKLPPVFEVSDGNLLMRGDNKEYSFTWDVENNKWITYSTKAGA